MAKLDLGFNFTQKHFDTLMRLLGQHKKPSKIWSIYGSPGTLNPFGSVRETYRESTPELWEVESWLNQLKFNGVEINFTLNSLMPMHQEIDGNHKRGLDGVQENLLNYITWWDKHVDNWIISHPGIIDLIHEKLPQINIIVSTIMNVHALPQLEWILYNWPQVVRVCPAIEKNRDFMWLRSANHIIPLELLANEFCSMGGVDCEGLYRQMCYMTQSMKLGGWCARDKCIEQRKENPFAWLQSRFILPQWMSRYKAETGIEHFKITGRTHGPEYLDYIASTYMNERAEGNLLSLWGQLEATVEGKDQSKEQQDAEKALNIPIGLLDDFLDYDKCRADTCGRLCQKCRKIWEKYNETIKTGKKKTD